MGAWTCCHEAIVERRLVTTRSELVDCSSKSSSFSSFSLDSPSLVSTSSSSWATSIWVGFRSKFVTASFAVLPRSSTFDLRKSLQIGQTLISRRLHSRWKDYPQPRKMRHKGLSRLHFILSHLLCQMEIEGTVWTSYMYIGMVLYFI